MLILISKKTNNFYYIKNEEQDFHCKEGFIKTEHLKDEKLEKVKSNTGIEFYKFNSNNYDLHKKIKRGPQIITIKDLGYIIARCGINKNSTILEAGGGSGSGTIFFSNICKEIKTYEIREENFKLIKKNIEKFNPEIKNCEIILGDLLEKIEEEKNNYDILFLDMPSSHLILEKNLNGVVKKGGFICLYLPSIFQIETLYKTIENNDNYFIEEISETILRKWKIKHKISHPENKKEIDHTAFLVFIRKVKNE
jgi:tRNA (adenine57-N1/adenine58-N1)-methyltransferase catalytic subunit